MGLFHRFTETDLLEKVCNRHLHSHHDGKRHCEGFLCCQMCFFSFCECKVDGCLRESAAQECACREDVVVSNEVRFGRKKKSVCFFFLTPSLITYTDSKNNLVKIVWLIELRNDFSTR